VAHDLRPRCGYQRFTKILMEDFGAISSGSSAALPAGGSTRARSAWAN